MPRREMLLGAGLLILCFLLKVPSLGLPLFNMDDWGGLRDGLTMLYAGPDILTQILLGEMGPRGARPVPSAVWAFGWLVFGGWDGGYYLLDLLIHLAGGAALFALLARWTGPIGASVGCAIYLFDARVHQVGYLGALDDNLVTTLCLLTLALWPRARQSGRWAALCGLLVLLALLTKSTAVVLPVALMGLDLVDQGRGAWADRAALLRRYGAVAVAGFLFAVHLWGLLSHPEMARGRALPLLAQIREIGSAVGTNVFLPVASRAPQEFASVVDVVRWFALFPAVFVAMRLRGPSRPLLAFGVFWALAAAWLPMRFLLAFGNGRVEDRHTLMPAVGICVVLAALLAGRRHATSRILSVGAAVFVVGSALGFAMWDTPILAAWDRSAAPALRETLREAVEELPEGADIHLGLARLEHGTLGMLDFWILSRLVPGLVREPRLFLLGADVEAGDFEGPQPRITSPFSLDDHVEWGEGEALVVEEVRLEEGGATSAFRLVRREDLRDTVAGAPPRSWTFPGDAERWEVRRVELALPDEGSDPADIEDEDLMGPLPILVDERGLTLRGPPDDRAGSAGIVHAMTRPSWATPPAMVSPELDIDGAAYCGLEVEQASVAAPGGIPPRPRRGDYLSPGCGGALFFSAGGDFLDETVGLAHLPHRCGGGPQRLSARLDNVPAWRNGRIRRLAYVPAREYADVTVRSVVLVPCAE